ncbi:MAG: HNH/ENDO VII family nuclease [Tsuneonella suprasediminis]|nr:HNH/ENDO VII family nuclease [Altererythrobacter sp. N1]
MGAATSVVLNNLLDGLGAPRDEDLNHDGAIDTADERLSLEDQQARTNLVATLVTAIAEGAGLDATSANHSARIETQNNANVVSNGKTIIQVAEQGGVSIEEFKAGWPDAWNEALGLFGGNEEALIAHLRSPEGQSLEEAGDAYMAAQIEMAAGGDSAMLQKLQDKYASGTLSGAQIAEMAEAGRQLYLENAIANAAGPAVTGEVIVKEMIAAGLVSPNAAQLPFAEFAANYSGPLGQYVMSSGKRPNAPAIVGMIAGGVLAMGASHLIPDLPEPVQETFPAYPPDSKAGIEAYPDQSEEVWEYGQLPGLLPEPALSPPPVTPMPDAQPPLPGYGEGADVPTGPDVLANDNAGNSGRFRGVTARNADEAQFLRNAEATFGDSSTWTNVTRHRGELVVQRSDIELSSQNITRMRNGQAPFVRNASGDWEPLQLHHVGRETGQMIEVTRSQNRYNPTTGGPLHILGPGSPIRQPNYSQSYWQERYQGFVNSGQITE